MPLRATQDGWVIVVSSDRVWFTGGQNDKPLQYSCLENPMNGIKRREFNFTQNGGCWLLLLMMKRFIHRDSRVLRSKTFSPACFMGARVSCGCCWQWWESYAGPCFVGRLSLADGKDRKGTSKQKVWKHKVSLWSWCLKYLCQDDENKEQDRGGGPCQGGDSCSGVCGSSSGQLTSEVWQS